MVTPTKTKVEQNSGLAVLRFEGDITMQAALRLDRDPWRA